MEELTNFKNNRAKDRREQSETPTEHVTNDERVSSRKEEEERSCQRKKNAEIFLLLKMNTHIL